MGNGGAVRDAAMIQSVDRAIRILELIAERGACGGSEAARELRVHRSTALRLLATLERNGLVERGPGPARFRMGPRLPQLASAARGEVDLRRLGQPVCERLAAELGETVTLEVLDGDAMLPICEARGSAVLGVTWLGRRTTAVHCTAGGKVILAFAPEQLVRRFVKPRLDRRTPRSIVAGSSLRAQLAAIRENGYGATEEELELGLSAVAAPVRDVGRDVAAALAVSGPTSRLRAPWPPAMLSRLNAAAADLSLRLGHRDRFSEATRPLPLESAGG